MKLTRTTVVAVSQASTIMQPTAAEDYEFPAQIANECQSIADSRQLPVTLLCKHGDRHVFQPVKAKRISKFGAPAKRKSDEGQTTWRGEPKRERLTKAAQ